MLVREGCVIEGVFVAETVTSLAGHSCEAFCAELAARTSTPGGGGASALAGALGMALCSMAGNFAVGKPFAAAFEDELNEVLEEAEDIRGKLIDLIDADADAFAAFSHAHAFPKTDPLRRQILEAATTQAAFVPIETMRQVARAIELLERMESMASRLLISDVGCGAALCASALTSASLNVYVNTRALANREHAAELDAEVDRILTSYIPRAEAIVSRVTERIRKDA